MKVLFDEPQKVPVKVWDGDGAVPFEVNAFTQARNLAQMPFVYHHVALMPDAHVGIGSTVGSVVATIGAIIPASVGVDIGCGMAAQKTTLRAEDLPDDLGPLRAEIERVVPHGRTDNGGPNDRGAWGSAQIPLHWWTQGMEDGLSFVRERIGPSFNRWDSVKVVRQLGTLGTGNHFIEVCVDTAGAVWIMLHSGSRGIGNAIGQHYIGAARKEMQRWMINLPDQDLAYLPDGTDLFRDYVGAVGWAQSYAAKNRLVMMDSVICALAKIVGEGRFQLAETAVNCHHNYVERENHFGKNVLVTRKGAVRARKGDLGIIPGSMGARSFIVRGLGNPESFDSCSHGAGRVLSRTAAKKAFTQADLVEQTVGVECRKDADVIDEAPKAYKDIAAVMAAQSDLVEVVAELKQLVCIKG